MTVQLELVSQESSTWVDWLSYLTGELGYSDDQVTRDREVDLIHVYADPAKKHVLALIGPKTIQAADLIAHARRAHARYCVIGHPRSHSIHQVGHYSVARPPIDHLPSYPPGLRRFGQVSRRHVLPPFHDEDHLRRAFAACHDAMYLESAKDPAAAFDLLLLLLTAKVLDEKSDAAHYEFGRSSHESEQAAVDRIESLMGRARDWLWKDQTPEWRAAYGLGGRVAEAVLVALQDYSLTLTSFSPDGTDLLGIAYEQLVGDTFRGELGSYFTPRNVADFMVRLMDIRSGDVLDPSCGSAGLLMAALRSAEHHADKPDVRRVRLFGNDLNPRMVETSRLNFVLHDLDPGNVLEGDGLDLPRLASAWSAVTLSPNGYFWDTSTGNFDYVVANPPFAGFVRDIAALRRFETANRGAGAPRTLNRTLPFLEVILASLKEGGLAGVVVPTSILNAEEDSFVRFRELLLHRAELVAIIELPEKAFVHTGCGIHGALVFFRRSSSPRTEYDVFATSVKDIGYDTTGKPTRSNDFPAVLTRFESGGWLDHERVSISVLRREQRWDPSWLDTVARFQANEAVAAVALTDLVQIRDARWSRKQLSPDAIYTYFEVGDADPYDGRIRRTHTVTGFELAKKGRIRNVVRSGDVLLPNHRDSLMSAAARDGRSAVLVKPDHDAILTTDRWMVLTPKIDPVALVTILNSHGVRQQLIAQARGAASLDIRESTLKKVRVPRSLLEAAVTERLVELSMERDEARERLERADATLRASLASHFD